MSSGKRAADDGEAALSAISQRHYGLGEALELAKKVDEEIAKWTRDKEANDRDIAQRRQALAADLKHCDVNVHSFEAGGLTYYTTSDDMATAHEQVLRMLALDYDAFCTHHKRPLRDLDEDARLEALNSKRAWEISERIAIRALLQHGPGVFEMHRHEMRYSGKPAPFDYSIGRAGVAAALNEALVDQARCDPNITVLPPRKIDLCFTYGGDAALRRLAQGMTPEAIAQEIMENVQYVIRQRTKK